MKRFQDLITQQKTKKIEKLTFRGLSNTIDLQKLNKHKKSKDNCISFKNLVQQVKKNITIVQMEKQNQSVQFTLKKDKKQNIQNENYDDTIVCKKIKPNKPQTLEGIDMIDSVAIDQSSIIQYSQQNEKQQNHNLNTVQKKQIQNQLNKITVNLKNKLVRQSKNISSFKQIMKQVNQALEHGTEQVYSKILNQRATSRGTSSKNSPKSNISTTPKVHSFLSVVSKTSPLIAKYHSNHLSPVQFSSPKRTIIKTQRNKSTSRFINKIPGSDSINVTQFKFQ